MTPPTDRGYDVWVAWGIERLQVMANDESGDEMAETSRRRRFEAPLTPEEVENAPEDVWTHERGCK